MTPAPALFLAPLGPEASLSRRTGRERLHAKADNRTLMSKCWACQASHSHAASPESVRAASSILSLIGLLHPVSLTELSNCKQTRRIACGTG